MSYPPVPNDDNTSDSDDGLLLWLLLAGAPAGGGGCCVALVAIMLCSGIGLGGICQFLQDNWHRLLGLTP